MTKSRTSQVRSSYLKVVGTKRRCTRQHRKQTFTQTIRLAPDSSVKLRWLIVPESSYDSIHDFGYSRNFDTRYFCTSSPHLESLLRYQPSPGRRVAIRHVASCSQQAMPSVARRHQRVPCFHDSADFLWKTFNLHLKAHQESIHIFYIHYRPTETDFLVSAETETLPKVNNWLSAETEAES